MRGFLLNTPEFDGDTIVGWDKIFRVYSNDKNDFTDYDILVDDLEIEIVDKNVKFINDEDSSRIEYKI